MYSLHLQGNDGGDTFPETLVKTYRSTRRYGSEDSVRQLHNMTTSNVRRYMSKVVLVMQWLVCLPLDPNVEGSNPVKAMNF
jgi:hypothetical protein